MAASAGDTAAKTLLPATSAMTPERSRRFMTNPFHFEEEPERHRRERLLTGPMASVRFGRVVRGNWELHVNPSGHQTLNCVPIDE